MKQQCETTVDCLKELVKVMEQFGIGSMLEAVQSGYVRCYGYPWPSKEVPRFSEPASWSFAIGEVEDKPVFAGDKLWSGYFNNFAIVTGIHSDGYFKTDLNGSSNTAIACCSWNPPKSKTVLVELTREDAEYWTSEIFSIRGRLPDISEYNKASNNFYAACEKALAAPSMNYL